MKSWIGSIPTSTATMATASSIPRPTATIEWGKEKTKAWLQILNDHFIGNKKYLCGNDITIADYFGFAIVQVGELIRCNFKPYPNVARWLATMHERPGTAKIYEVI